MTVELQARIFHAVDERIREAQKSGSLANEDVVGAAHIGALIAMEMALQYVATTVDRELR